MMHNPPDNMNQVELAAWLGLQAAQELAHATASNAGWYRDPNTGEPISPFQQSPQTRPRTTAT